MAAEVVSLLDGEIVKLGRIQMLREKLEEFARKELTHGALCQSLLERIQQAALFEGSTGCASCQQLVEKIIRHCRFVGSLFTHYARRTRNS
ncbi:hypothetical protein NKH74_24350 [Mesorhizobium sp. M0933]|uniref:hypothetical protein n=1 Tax=Mesorhizobium sp. M0933 TaxID=2957030 RepID=UPI003336931F